MFQIYWLSYTYSHWLAVADISTSQSVLQYKMDGWKMFQIDWLSYSHWLAGYDWLAVADISISQYEPHDEMDEWMKEF